MPKICVGCGAIMQNEDKNRIGYTPKMDGDFCQRCFRIRHYNDVMISMQQGIDPSRVLERIEKLDALVVWVVDLFDFEANMIPGIHRHLMGKDIVMVATKRDLLPITLSDHKLGDFLFSRLKAYGISVKEIVITSNLLNRNSDDYKESRLEILEAIEQHRNGKDVVVMGMANAGKSTMLNAISDANITTSFHPGTTLDFLKIDMKDYMIYDTPGLTRMDSLLTHIDANLLKKVIPLKPLKPRVYQLYENQTLSLGGMVRVDFQDVDKISAVAYFAQELNIHRSKQEKADRLWTQHFNEMLSPVIDEDVSKMKKYEIVTKDDHFDIVIHGLGWFCISGHAKRITLYVSEKLNYTVRKAMI